MPVGVAVQTGFSILSSIFRRGAIKVADTQIEEAVNAWLFPKVERLRAGESNPATLQQWLDESETVLSEAQSQFTDKSRSRWPIDIGVPRFQEQLRERLAGVSFGATPANVASAFGVPSLAPVQAIENAARVTAGKVVGALNTAAGSVAQTFGFQPSQVTTVAWVIGGVGLLAIVFVPVLVFARGRG